MIEQLNGSSFIHSLFIEMTPKNRYFLVPMWKLINGNIINCNELATEHTTVNLKCTIESKKKTVEIDTIGVRLKWPVFFPTQFIANHLCYKKQSHTPNTMGSNRVEWNSIFFKRKSTFSWKQFPLQIDHSRRVKF